MVERFCGMRSDKFNRITEPWEVEEWLRGMDIIFDTMGCSRMEKHRLATYQLTYTTAEWWELEKVTLGEKAI